MKKKVSVIVVTYNQRDSISRTLDHILSQRVDFPFEIVVGDDASADGTRAVCEEYARRYPEVVRLMPAAPNKGVTRNYFDCLESACGEYVADCAGDDYWIDPDKLAGQVAVLDSDPEIALVHTAWRTSAGETVWTIRRWPAAGMCFLGCCDMTSRSRCICARRCTGAMRLWPNILPTVSFSVPSVPRTCLSWLCWLPDGRWRICRR